MTALLQHGYDLINSGDYAEAEIVFGKCPSGTLATRGLALAQWLAFWQTNGRAISARLTAILDAESPVKLILNINKYFKWQQQPSNNLPLWTSPYLGSSDLVAVPQEKELLALFAKLQHDGWNLRLVSVIGGCYFLRMLEHFTPTALHLFDINVNEHAKLAFLIKYLATTEFDQFHGLKDVASFINAHPHLFYIPQAAGRDMQMKFAADATFSWDGLATRLTSVFSPVYYPEYAWTPSRAAYQRAVTALLERIDANLHFEIPALDAQGDIVIFFASNAAIPYAAMVEQISNSQLIIPVYSHQKNNESALDAHAYWRLYAQRCCAGRRTVQVWPPEHGAIADDLSYRNVALDAYNDAPADQVVLFHIVLGNAPDAATFSQRQTALAQALAQAGARVETIIVAEYNPDCGQFPDQPWLPTTTELADFVGHQLARYRHSATWFAPGAGALDRNQFLVFDRIG